MDSCNLFAKSKGKEKEEKGREQELTGDELAQILCSIWWQSFVSSYYVLTVFLHWNYKMKYSCYQDFFGILGWLFTWFLVEKCAAWQKVVANHCFQKKIYISILTLSAHTASLALGKIQKLLAGQTGDFGKWIKIRFLQSFCSKPITIVHATYYSRMIWLNSPV